MEFQVFIPLIYLNVNMKKHKFLSLFEDHFITNLDDKMSKFDKKNTNDQKYNKYFFIINVNFFKKNQIIKMFFYKKIIIC